MPGRVSCRLYLLLDALENFDISRDRSKYNRQETHTVIIFYIYLTILYNIRNVFVFVCIAFKNAGD